jgi:hypothetical protein
VNCLTVREHLPELAMGVLPEADRTAVERHLQWCAGCRKEAADLGQAAATFAFALAPEPVPGGLGDHVVNVIKQAAGVPGSRRRLHAAAASVVAAMVAVAGLGWGAAMAGRAERFADRARAADQRQAAALEQFRRVIVGLRLGTQLPTGQTHLGQLSPPAGRVGGGAVLQLVSPTTLDFVIVIVNGLTKDAAPLPYRITLQNSAGELLKAGDITKLDQDGGAQVFHQFKNRDLTGYSTVIVRDAAGQIVLRGTVDQTSEA